MSELKDKVVLLTGASSEIGHNIALQLAVFGANLTLVGRNMEYLQHITRYCVKAGASKTQIMIVEGDVSQANSIQYIVQRTVTRFGKLDVLINGVDVHLQDNIETTSLEHLDIMLNAHVRGPFFLTKSCVPYLLQSKGSIINLSSEMFPDPFQECLTYGLSKAAMDHFTKSLALELQPKGVTVNTISILIKKTKQENVVELGESIKRNSTDQDKPGIRLHANTEGIVNAIMLLLSDRNKTMQGMKIPIRPC